MRIKAMLRALGLVAAVWAGGGYAEDLTERLPAGATEAFIECGESAELTQLLEHLMTAGRVLVKADAYFELALQGEVLGLPFSRLWVGVCDALGERACGWASFRAYRVDLPFAAAKQRLLEQYKIDFTAEARALESDVTLRPVLVFDEAAQETTLMCDPGSL